MDDERRFADFMRIGADWFWETDSDGRFSYFSVAVSQAGMPLTDRIGFRRRDGAVPEPENLARLAALEETTARREAFRDVVYHARLGDKAARWCSVSGEPIYDDAGAFLGYRGVGRDVTAQVEAQKLLETQSRALEAILRATPDGVQVVDKAYASLAVNDQLFEILGIPNRKDQPDSVRQSLLDMAKRGEYGPGDPELLAHERYESMFAAIYTQRQITYERQLKTGRWVEGRLRLLDDGAFLSLYRDITGAKEREAELERQSALLATIAANMDGGLSMVDKEGRLTAWNDRFADLTGIAPALVRRGAMIRDLLISQARAGEFGPCDPEAEADRRLAAFHTDYPVNVERSRPDGRIIEVRRNPVPGGGAVTIYIDVTARKRAEQALQDINATLEERIAERTKALAESELSQRTLVANVPGTVYRRKHDRDWTMMFVSEGCRDLLGLAPEDLKSGRIVYNDLIHPQDREAVWQKAQADFAEGQRFEFEYRVRHADGTWRWVWDRAQAVRSASGAVVELKGLTLDITARKNAEQESRRARDNLVDAIESLDHGLMLYDRDERLILFNHHIHDQYQRADRYFVIGHTFEQMFRDGIENGTLAVPPGQTKEQFVAERVARWRRQDGTVTARRLPDGRVLHITERPSRSGGVVSIGRDVTAQLKLEEQLRQAQKMDAIGRLTGGLAHDLNNYLAVIMGNLDLLADRPHVDPEATKLVAAAIGGALRGAELTRSLLAFARRQPLDPKVLDVGRRIASVVKLLKPTIGEKIAVSLGISSGLWPVKVDGAQLDTCIVNLATNARDAMPGGGSLSITARNVSGEADGAPPGDHVLIELADSGMGMSTETLGAVFEPFFTTKGPGHGTGLGLSMVHGFVHQSGGVIRIASAPAKGTTVRIFLPRATAAAAGQEGRPKPAAAPQGSERILLVEDNEDVRAAAVEQLTSLGYDVVEAESGDAALALLERENGEFDLVFTDLVMPGRIDGYELAGLVLERWPDKKVLLTSGFSAGIADMLEEQAMGLALLRKPYRKADLARAVRATLAA